MSRILIPNQGNYGEEKVLLQPGWLGRYIGYAESSGSKPVNLPRPRSLEEEVLWESTFISKVYIKPRAEWIISQGNFISYEKEISLQSKCCNCAKTCLIGFVTQLILQFSLALMCCSFLFWFCTACSHGSELRSWPSTLRVPFHIGRGLDSGETRKTLYRGLKKFWKNHDKS